MAVEGEVRRGEIYCRRLTSTVASGSDKCSNAETEGDHGGGDTTQRGQVPKVLRSMNWLCLESLRGPQLEADRRFGRRRELDQGVSYERELLELSAAARTGRDVAQNLGSPATGQDPQRQLSEVVLDRFTPRRAFDVAAHWASTSSATRSLAIPKRIRPFAVPSGMASALAISVALRPYMAASKTARR